MSRTALPLHKLCIISTTRLLNCKQASQSCQELSRCNRTPVSGVARRRIARCCGARERRCVVLAPRGVRAVPSALSQSAASIPRLHAIPPDLMCCRSAAEISSILLLRAKYSCSCFSFFSFQFSVCLGLQNTNVIHNKKKEPFSKEED